MKTQLLKKAKRMLVSLLDNPYPFEMEEFHCSVDECGCFAWHLQEKKIITEEISDRSWEEWFLTEEQIKDIIFEDKRFLNVFLFGERWGFHTTFSNSTDQILDLIGRIDFLLKNPDFFFKVGMK